MRDGRVRPHQRSRARRTSRAARRAKISKDVVPNKRSGKVSAENLKAET